jgi:hypothetical protein
MWTQAQADAAVAALREIAQLPHPRSENTLRSLHRRKNSTGARGTAPRAARRDLPETAAEGRLGRRLAWLTMGRDTARHI